MSRSRGQRQSQGYEGEAQSFKTSRYKDNRAEAIDIVLGCKVRVVNETEGTRPRTERDGYGDS